MKRNFGALYLVLIALAALLGARGSLQLIRVSMAADEHQLALSPVIPHHDSTASEHPRTADPILARNPFDSVTGPLRADVPSDPNAVEAADPWNAPMCDGVKVLIIAQSADPAWSFAALEGTTETKSVLRRQGDEFAGRTIKQIGYNPVAGVPAVWMTTMGTSCQAKMFSGTKAPGNRAASVDAGDAGEPGLTDEIRKSIVRAGANEFDVERGVVDEIIENQAELMKFVRVVPERVDGRVTGIRLYGIRPDTLLGILGMENGDLLQTINGFDLASPEKALEAYARLRNAEHVTLQVNRKGVNQNLNYDIR